MTKQELFEELPAPKKTDKILLITHNDMDAAGAYIALSSVIDCVDVRFCSNDEMSKTILNVILDDELMSDYNMVIACDISCNTDDAKAIDASPNATKFVLLDHHITAMGLKKYKWACVEKDIVTDSYRAAYYLADENVKKEYEATGAIRGMSSGASLMFDYLDFNGYLYNYTNQEFVKKLIHLIAAYDTFDCEKVFHEMEPYESLDKLCDLYGVEYFAKSFCEKVQDANREEIFDDIDKTLLDIEDRKIKNALSRGEKHYVDTIISVDKQEYTMVYAHVTEYLQEHFAHMKKLYPGRQLYLINHGTGVSLRTDDKDMDVAKFAAAYGGGGHKEASGFKIPDYKLEHYLADILNANIIKSDLTHEE